MTKHLLRNGFSKSVAFSAGALTLGAALVAAVHAQSTMQGVPNAMQGFSQNRDQPIQIEAASLEMRDKKKEATFAGNVKVVQGDTTMTSKTLVVFYESGGDKPAAPQPAAKTPRRRHRCNRQRQGRTAAPRSSGWKRAAMSW